jgi:T5SS/PEP-CTERM-associated repeat protein
MTTKTWGNAAGGSWETGTNWNPSGVPGDADDALINGTGTYGVTVSAIETPNSVTVSDPGATLTIAAAGELFGSTLTMNAGTLVVAGTLLGATVVNNGGVFGGGGGTLDGVTWQGPLAGPNTSYQSIGIADGLTLLNAAGTGPGTLDINSLYMVSVLDSTPLSNMTINFDAYNLEYLFGPASSALILDSSTTVNQSLAGSSGSVSGAKLINNGTVNLTGSASNFYFQSTVFDNAGSVLAGGGDHVTITAGFTNTASVTVTGGARLGLSSGIANALSNSGTIAVSVGGSLVVAGSLAGGGVITLATLAVADMYNTNNAVTFLDGKGTLRLEAPGSFTGGIAGLQKGDKIDLLATPVTKLSYAGTTASGVLTVMNSGATVAALTLLGDYLQSTFGFLSDGTTGNNISVVVSTIAPRILDWTGAGGTTAFNAPSNWNDVSDTLDPALTAPTLVDTVVFDTIGGAVSGTGTIAALDVGSSGTGVLQLSNGTTLITGSLDAGTTISDDGQIGVTGSGTDLTVKGSATIADDGAGVLTVLSGATVSATNLTIGNLGDSSGAVVVSGAGSVINLSGNLNVGTALGTGDLTIGPGGVVNAKVINLQGQVVLENGELDPTVNLINQGQTAGGSGTIAAGDIVDEGVIQAGASKPSQKLLVVSGTVLGGGPWTINGTAQAQANGGVGVLQINAGGTLELTGPILNAGSTTFTDDVTPQSTYTVTNSVVEVNFADATGVLLLDDIAGFAGTIAAVQKGDSFVVTGGTLSGPAVSNGNTLTVADSGHGGTDQLIFASSVNASGFSIVSGNTIQVACFAAETRIATETGFTAVEHLNVGDRVVTADGRVEPIVWIGQRTVHCARHPKPDTVWPVRISAGAFGENVPVRDLYLSPDHAVFVNGALVPVKLLMNGTSVTRVKRSKVTYYHVELRQHEVILAEALPVESYLDIGDRANFEQSGAAIRLFPDFAVKLEPRTALLWETRGAAPLVVSGRLLAAARAAVRRDVPRYPGKTVRSVQVAR